MSPVAILGIDYGTKRWGLAYADEVGIALPLSPIVFESINKRWEALASVVAARKVTLAVIGYPVDPQGNPGSQARLVDIFIAQLEQRLGLPVARQDERYSSQMACEGVKAAKLNKNSKAKTFKKQVRLQANIDSRAAAIILQDYLDQPQ